MKKKLQFSKKNVLKKRSASATLFIIFFFLVLLAFSAFAVDGTIVLTNRVKLQNAAEASVLAAAAVMNSTSDVAKVAKDTFNSLKIDSLQNASVILLNVNQEKKQVLLTVQYISQPIFLSFLGVTGIKLEAKACAMNEEISALNLNWVDSVQYYANILDANTSIKKPLGGYVKSASYDTSNKVKYSQIEQTGLSLGPGGYVTISLRSPLMDKPGADFRIKENGYSLEGYMVFAGIDNTPEAPYESSASSGGGVTWVNVSSCGTSFDGITNPVSTVVTSSLGSQNTFFGGGDFDIAKAGISMVKYIRIVDDNRELAYPIGGGNVMYNILGESSTSTAGVDISEIKILQNVRLIRPSLFDS